MSEAQAIYWTNERRKLRDLVPWEGNPRQSTELQVKRIEGSIRKFGYSQPLEIEPDNTIIDGHQRDPVMQMMREYGPEAEIDVRVASRKFTLEERKEYIAMKHQGAVGEWNWDQMLNLYDGPELLEWGFNKDTLEAHGFEFGDEMPEDPGAQVDKAAELLEKWQVEPGQLWEIGQHRLICGDCTDPATVARVMAGEKAALCVTSPPYGVGKNYETKGVGPWFDTVRPAIVNCCKVSNIVIWNIGDLYSTGSQFIEPTFSYSVSMFTENGFRPIWIRIWLKQGMNFGIGAYHLVTNKPVQQYEYIGAFQSADLFEDPIISDGFEWIIAFAGSKHKYVRRLDQKDRRTWGYSGVWQINTVTTNDVHSAMFPLELPERCIKMHSDKCNIVYEPFCGSGTTLVACERLGRRGRGIEISPAYCAVTLERLAQMGLTPRLIEATP